MRKMRNILEKEDKILVAYLFGSQARGDADSRSDIDIGLVLREGADRSLKEQSRLALRLEKTLGKEVDLVILNGKQPRFLAQVLQYGKPVFVRSEKARIRFETVARSKYLDMKHHIDEYDRMVRKRMAA